MPPTHVLNAEHIFRGQETLENSSDLTFHLPEEVSLRAHAVFQRLLYSYLFTGGS